MWPSPDVNLLCSGIQWIISPFSATSTFSINAKSPFGYINKSRWSSKLKWVHVCRIHFPNSLLCLNQRFYYICMLHFANMAFESLKLKTFYSTLNSWNNIFKILRYLSGCCVKREYKIIIYLIFDFRRRVCTWEKRPACEQRLMCEQRPICEQRSTYERLIYK